VRVVDRTAQPVPLYLPIKCAPSYLRDERNYIT